MTKLFHSSVDCWHELLESFPFFFVEGDTFVSGSQFVTSIFSVVVSDVDHDASIKLVDVDPVAMLLTDVHSIVVQVQMTENFLFTLPYIRKVPMVFTLDWRVM